MQAWSTSMLVAALASGCSCATTSVVGGVDAGDAPDVSGPTVDAAQIDARDASDDGSVSVIDAWDAPADASDAAPFDCSSCAPAGPCETLMCAGACAYGPVADGTACGADVCVAGVCEPRRCGDGWRERGDALTREGCDDRNTAAGDGCSDTCEPEALTVGTNPDRREWTTTGAGSAAVDDEGNLLIVWARERPSGEDAMAVLGRRFDRFGGPIDAEPFRLDTVLSGDSPEPATVGLASGWAVAWSSRSIEGSDGVAYGLAGSIIPVVGAPGTSFEINTVEDGTQDEASLGRVGAGFVVAWEHQTAGPSDVVARLYEATGSPRSAEIPIAATSAGEGSPRVVALGGDDWLIGWIEAPGVAIRARRYSAAAAGSGYRLIEDTLDSFVLARAAGSLVVGARDVIDTGTIGVGTFDLAATKADRADMTWMGSARDERDLAIAAIGSDGWLAVYRSTEIGGDRGRVVVSPTATEPPDLELLRSALRDGADVERFSIAPSLDGWIVTWTVRLSSGPYEVRAFRLSP